MSNLPPPQSHRSTAPAASDSDSDFDLPSCYTNEEYKWANSMIVDDPMSPEKQTPPTSPIEFYLDEAFLEELGLIMLAPTPEFDQDYGNFSNTLPPPPPESLPEAAPVTAANRGRRPQSKVNRWSKEEHELFLKGIEKYGRGDWKNISREFVKTRTHIQLASHAQKYYEGLRKALPTPTQAQGREGQASTT